MSWKNKSVMESKKQFIQMWKSDVYIFSSLCEHFEISRRTGYNLIKSYQQYGDVIFEGRSKRPLNIPNKTPEHIEASIVVLRKKHKAWGARKIKKLLEQEYGVEEIPSETTINAILKRNNLIVRRRRRYKKTERLNNSM